LVTVCATLAATASVALASSSYSAVITPKSAAAGATQVFNVALTNNTASNGINFAMITPPQGFTLSAASLPPGATGTIQLQPNKVIIRGLSVPPAPAPGSTVNVSVTATAPAQDPGSNNWKTQAFSNGPNSAGVFIDDGTSTVSTPTTSPQTITNTCPANQGCPPPPLTLSTPSTSFSLQVGSGSTDATVTQSVDTGTPMDGLGGLGGCAGYTPQSPDWYGFNVSDINREKTVTWTVNNSDPSTFRVCFGAPYPFVGGQSGGTLPDGTKNAFVGLLPICSPLETPTVTDVTPAASSDAVFICANISSPEGSPTTTIATFTIPGNQGLTGDPWFGR
jgi:hypothetical protein